MESPATNLELLTLLIVFHAVVGLVPAPLSPDAAQST
jgi:hypothetical protein